MERYIEDKLMPKLDAVERRIAKAEDKIDRLATKFNAPPTVDFTITSTNAETAIDNALKIYKAFGDARTNFNLKVTLNELTAEGGA